MVAGFLGRPLKAQENEILQEECVKFNRKESSSNTTTNNKKHNGEVVDDDQVIARNVVQSFMSIYFLQLVGHDSLDISMNDQESRNQDTAQALLTLTKRRNNSILEAEFAQVESMAIQKLQAWTRGVLCREQDLIQTMKVEGATTALCSDQQQTSTSAMQQQPADSTVAVSEVATDPLLLLLPSFRRVLSVPSERKTGHFLDPADVPLEIKACCVQIQAHTRGFLVRNQLQSTGIIVSRNKYVGNKQEATIPSQPENDIETPETSKAINHESELQQNMIIPATVPTQTVTPKRTKSLVGMMYLNKSQSQLQSITFAVKQVILMKLQALIRAFLVRCRKRRLRKERSIRALLLRPGVVFYEGTTEAQDAATIIQTRVRVYVQRWKYRMTVRQKQLNDIKKLQSKQLRKIEERKKSVFKSCKQRIVFDATSVARQLQRAKRVIKFLVKQEERAKAENEHLFLEVSELTKHNQRLENEMQTSTESSVALQNEIAEFKVREERLQAERQKYEATVDDIATKLKETDENFNREKRHKEQVQACIKIIKRRATIV